ncbi:MAG: hypothetical protein SVV03_05430, partial [Candidatus Nanohaloarchaea archaeon]|nr:hypothetical protein [Candidatus Nanohaloarchaea archaeon]
YMPAGTNYQPMAVRKGITLRMVGGVILALIGVAILIGLFAEQTGPAFQSAFCTSYRGITSVLPGDSTAPSGCKESQVEYKAVEIVEEEELQLQIASAVMDCWQKYKGYQTEKELCQGWNIKKLEGTITEQEVEQLMRENNLIPRQIKEGQLQFTGSAEGGIEKGQLITIQYAKPKGGAERIEVG